MTGIGDEIMASGEAVRLQASDPRPVCIVDYEGRPRWHEVWDHNPRIVQTTTGAQTLLNAPGFRPYIASVTPERFFFTDWQATRGEIVLTTDERRWADRVVRGHEPFIVIEASLDPGASPNRQWGRWDELAHRLWLAGFTPVQLGAERPVETPEHATWVPTPTFRHACAVLALAEGGALPEGALHHAAAALHVPAVVIFGGHTHPRTTGYEGHVNLFTGDDSTLGWRIPHRGSKAAMRAITVEQVMSAAMEIV